jgi:hypothetical protein
VFVAFTNILCSSSSRYFVKVIIVVPFSCVMLSPLNVCSAGDMGTTAEVDFPFKLYLRTVPSVGRPITASAEIIIPEGDMPKPSQPSDWLTIFPHIILC